MSSSRLLGTRSILAALAVTCSAGCSLAEFAQSRSRGLGTATCAANGTETLTIYVSNLGWHTGIILPSDEAREALGDIFAEPHQLPWFEVGWGDRAFYMSSEIGYSSGFRALFFSDGSAVHVAGLTAHPKRYFVDSELCEVQIERTKLVPLLSFIRDHVALDENGQSKRLGDALYGIGSFYDGIGTFSVRRTCNNWTARALKTAGCEVDPGLIKASTLFAQLCPNLKAPE